MSSIQEMNLSEIPWAQIFTQTLDQPQALPAVLAGYGIDAGRLAAVSEKSPSASEAYGRKILFRNDKIEVMVASWSFQATAAPHNHGSSQGLIWFAQGNFYEQHYRFQNRELVQTDTPLNFKENQVVRVDANDIHSCCPETVGLTLHIYSPPIRQMKVWNTQKRSTLTVADECGAWIPQNQNLILFETAW